MNKLIKFSKGFTLVELMVAVAIISLLTGIIVTNLTSSKSKARDGKRISDMGQIQLAVELFFDRCKEYPMSLDPADDGSLGTGNAQQCPSGVTLGTYISRIPQPSAEAGQSEYEYFVNDGTDPTDYFLKAKLENYNEVLKNSLQAAPSWSTETCEATAAKKEYCISPGL